MRIVSSYHAITHPDSNPEGHGGRLGWFTPVVALDGEQEVAAPVGRLAEPHGAFHVHHPRGEVDGEGTVGGVSRDDGVPHPAVAVSILCLEGKRLP